MINNTLSVKTAVGYAATNLNSIENRVRVIRVFSNRMIHVRIGMGVPADVDTGMPISAGTAEYVALPANASLSFILAAGEPSGSVWTTEQ